MALADHSAALEQPRSRTTHGRTRATRTNFELYSWLFMRLSGLLLVFLVFGHLFVMFMVDEGINRLDFAFVAGRWSSPFWQTWDLLQLWLAELHGVNGLRTIINDYAVRDSTRFWLKMLLYTSALLVLFLGTLVIFTFDPNIAPGG
jgi:succinate dehydrogenase / fumarate reductase membrane anchor subunit